MHSELLAVMRNIERRDDVSKRFVITGTPPTFFCWRRLTGFLVITPNAVRMTQDYQRTPHDLGATFVQNSMRPVLDVWVSLASYRCSEWCSRRSEFCSRMLLRSAIWVGTSKNHDSGTEVGATSRVRVSWTLPRLIGTTRAADLLLSGRVVTVAETADWGLWNEVLPDGESTLSSAIAYGHPTCVNDRRQAVANAKRQLS